MERIVNDVLMFLILHNNVELKMSDTTVIIVFNTEVIVFPKKSLLWSAPTLKINGIGQKILYYIRQITGIIVCIFVKN